MNETRHTTRNILILVNLIIASGSFILKIIDPIVVSYTEDIRKADILNFTVFTPIIMVILSFLLHRVLRPVTALVGLANDMTPQQAQELRTAAFNLPLKTLILFNLVILSIVAFVALGFDAVFFPFYPFYKRFISMGLIWSYTICSSLAVYVYVKRRMAPILRSTSGIAGDKGYRMSIKTSVVAATLTLSAMIVLFLSVYGYSQAREALIRDDEEAASALLYATKQKAAGCKDVRCLKEYFASGRAGSRVYLIDSKGARFADKQGTTPDRLEKNRPVPKPEPAVAVREEDRTLLKLLPLGEPFEGLSLAAEYKTDHEGKRKLTIMTVFFLVIGLFFLAFAAIISHYVAGDASLALTDIENRMKRISEDKETLFKEFEVASLDEVGDLTRAFNSLQRAIRVNQQELDAANKKLLEMERRQAQEALQESERRYRVLAENMTDVIWTMDMNLKYTYVSPSITRLLGYAVREGLAMKVEEILTPTSYENAMKALAEEMALENTGKGSMFRSRTIELECICKDGSPVWTEVLLTFLRDADGRPTGILGVTRNISERKKLEDQLRHAQKMEAVGTLTGGIAHDFNNILTAIINCGNILHMKMDKGDSLNGYVKQILASADRAATLTQSLLAFSRKQIINPRPVNLHDIIKRMEKLLARLIGEDIELAIRPADHDISILADPGQVEQVLMNLATNARDAMPRGGHLIIETGRVELDDEFKKTYGYGEPGKYARISVVDTGTGMDEKTKTRIFDPFFTTKEVGKGTGLGLAIVYGIVKQHNGYIIVDSEPGRGTAFKIYLPLVELRDENETSSEQYTPKGGSETILVAEDNAEVRTLTREILEDFGYAIIEAVDGEDAMDKVREHKDGLQLLLLDVIMPKKNGKEVYEEAKKIKPGIKTIFFSGYTADIIQKKGIIEEGLNVISKPVLPTELLKKVRETLDA